VGNDGRFIWAMESTLEPVQIYVIIDFLQGMMSIDGKNIKAKVERKKGGNHQKCDFLDVAFVTKFIYYCLIEPHIAKCGKILQRTVDKMIKPNKDTWFVMKMNGQYLRWIIIFLHTIQLENCQNYYGKTMALLIAQMKKNKKSIKPRVVLQCMKPYMEN
jgi:hypothetical protein